MSILKLLRLFRLVVFAGLLAGILFAVDAIRHSVDSVLLLWLLALVPVSIVFLIDRVRAAKGLPPLE